MKVTANNSIGEKISFWFAVTSPLTGVIAGFLVPWFFFRMSS
jgi:hypothetical protein